MAYCTVSDLYTLGVHGGTTYLDGTTPTTPSLTQVNNWITYIYNDINSKLYANGVTIPIDSSTSPSAYALVKLLNAYGAAGMAEAIAYNENSGYQNDIDNNYTPSFFNRMYINKLKEYCEFPIYLIDAVLTSGAKNKMGPQETLMSNTIQDKYDFDYVDDLDEIKPNFRMDDEW